MHKTNPKVEAFIDRAKTWRKETEMLRAILLDLGLTEELKWGKPCYTFQESKIVLIQGFKEYCALLFFKGVLLKDPEGILKNVGEHSQIARQIRFTAAGEITDSEAILKTYVNDAIEVGKAGLKVEVEKNPEPIPAELQVKFDQHPAFKAAFDTLTPGRQRGYVLHFSAPKQSKTRESRIEKCQQRILDGKGLND